VPRRTHPDVVDRLKLRVGQGITGWLHSIRRQCCAREGGARIARFQFLTNCPKTAMKHFCQCRSCAGDASSESSICNIDCLTIQAEQIRLISTDRLLVGAEIDLRGSKKRILISRNSLRHARSWNERKVFCSVILDE